MTCQNVPGHRFANAGAYMSSFISSALLRALLRMAVLTLGNGMPLLVLHHHDVILDGPTAF